MRKDPDGRLLWRAIRMLTFLILCILIRIVQHCSR